MSKHRAGARQGLFIKHTGIAVAGVLLGLLLPSIAHAADRVLFMRLGPTKAALFVAQADGSGERAAGRLRPRWIMTRPGRPKATGSPLRPSATARPISTACIPTAAGWNG